MNITFIGGGNMASALIGGLLQQGFAASDLRVVELTEATRATLAQTFGVTVFAALNAEAAQSDVIVLAVKPQQLKDIAQALQPLLTQQLVVSIAAGVRAGDLARWLGGHMQLVRTMPNTPALVRQGMTGLYALPAVSAAQREQAQRIMAAVGHCVWLDDEAQLDAVTAVSGSGPAYVFYFIEALEAAGIELGLPAAQARELALGTFQGAAQLASGSPDAPAVLRAKVTSKGGTTERAIQSMESAAVKEKVIAAVKAAAARSKELGDQLGAG